MIAVWGTGGEKNDLIATHRPLAEKLAAELDQRLHSISDGPQSEAVRLDPEMIDDLRKLGYLK